MKIMIDTELKTLTTQNNGSTSDLDLYSPGAFDVLTSLWLKVGWNEKYPYTFTWLGRPIIQIPDDMIRIQEAIYAVKPDLILETGVAHGGSLIFYASLLKLLGNGRVIGIDLDTRPENRAAINGHVMAPLITLVDGDAIAADTVERVGRLVRGDERVMVILDSCHTKEHVLGELRAYARFVTPGSYVVVTDGCMRELYDVPRGKPEWKWNNPLAAIDEFLAEVDDFETVAPPRPFSESALTTDVTHWPGAWLRRRSAHVAPL